MLHCVQRKTSHGIFRVLNRKFSTLGVDLLPVIDISSLVERGSNGASKHAAVAKINAACERTGFFFIKNHGVSAADIGSANASAEALFGLSQEDKDSIPVKAEGGFTRGYIGIGGESGSDRLEVKEAFSYGYDWSSSRQPTNPLQGENVWPSATGFGREQQQSLLQFNKCMVSASEAVTRGLSLALGHSEEKLPSYCEEGDTISLMRIFHYMEHAAAKDMQPGAERIGSSPHTDWGFLTVISQETAGLELYHEGHWHSVPHIPGTLLVNVGDYLSMLTAGRYVSPIHRVLTDGDRISFVFFYYPSYDACIPVHTAGIGAGVDQRELEGFNNVLHGLETEPLQGAFGDFIARKWASVQRTGKSY